MAVAGWAKFTEVFCSSPKLITKLSREKPKRGSLTHWRVALGGFQQQRCFYCDSSDLASPHVDHVLPWSFILEDRTWNLVLSCSQCNGAKSDRLPTMEAVERLIERNTAILDGSAKVADMTFLRSFAEWHTRDLNGHVKALHDQAISDQYPVWQ